MKSTTLIFFLPIIIIMVPGKSVFGQKQYPISSLKDVVWIDRDEKSNVFIADQNSNIYKYDSLLQFQFVYSPNFPAYPDVLDASTTTKILVFNKDKQSYTFLDWLLSPISHHNIDASQFEYVSLITQSSQNSIWALDNVRFTLSKYIPNTNEKIVETNLETILDNELVPLYMKEYNNSLYISTTNNGILVFDNMGNYKKKIPFNEVGYFGFLGNRMLFTLKDSLSSFDLNTFQVKTIKKDFPHDLFNLLGQKIIFINNEGEIQVSTL